MEENCETMQYKRGLSDNEDLKKKDITKYTCSATGHCALIDYIIENLKAVC